LTFGATKISLAQARCLDYTFSRMKLLNSSLWLRPL